ncbi:MAG: flagellar protein export ATPase FliI [Pseudomonadales bacterium]|nr:flagellar protein export ATPase FliI [Pseudomonadales bacterium]
MNPTEDNHYLKGRKLAATQLSRYEAFCQTMPPMIREGKLTRMVGMTLEAVGCNVSIGGRCHIKSAGSELVEAEVVGFSGEKIFLMPVGPVDGLKPGASVYAAKGVRKVPAGEELLGRVLNGKGEVIDGKPPLKTEETSSLVGVSINPLHRQPIDQPLDVGIRTINALLTIGIGQRMGLFAGSGVGKSVLLGMMTKYTTADIIVVGLIGERGREVKEFIETILGEEGMKRSVVVASPADDPPLLRIHGAMMATAIAEHFRDKGKKVLLLMDSLTRFAQAQREIALAVGEPPATKGYPPSVFAKLPQLVERAGNGMNGKGSITAFYTVLTEGDDVQDPVADAARAILDGHIVLSRRLAEEGIYPAIDIEASISRVMPNIVDAESLALAQKFKQVYSAYEQSKDLISVGAYAIGSDPEIDFAIDKRYAFREYLKQGLETKVQLAPARAELIEVLKPEDKQLPSVT